MFYYITFLIRILSDPNPNGSITIDSDPSKRSDPFGFRSPTMTRSVNRISDSAPAFDAEVCGVEMPLELGILHIDLGALRTLEAGPALSLVVNLHQMVPHILRPDKIHVQDTYHEQHV